jgi:hypothetical protein
VSKAYHEALLAAEVDSTLFMVEGSAHRFQEDGAKAAVSARLPQFANDLN